MGNRSIQERMESLRRGEAQWKPKSSAPAMKMPESAGEASFEERLKKLRQGEGKKPIQLPAQKTAPWPVMQQAPALSTTRQAQTKSDITPAAVLASAPSAASGRTLLRRHMTPEQQLMLSAHARSEASKTLEEQIRDAEESVAAYEKRVGELKGKNTAFTGYGGEMSPELYGITPDTSSTSYGVMESQQITRNEDPAMVAESFLRDSQKRLAQFQQAKDWEDMHATGIAGFQDKIEHMADEEGTLFQELDQVKKELNDLTAAFEAKGGAWKQSEEMVRQYSLDKARLLGREAELTAQLDAKNKDLAQSRKNLTLLQREKKGEEWEKYRQEPDYAELLREAPGSKFYVEKYPGATKRELELYNYLLQRDVRDGTELSREYMTWLGETFAKRQGEEDAKEIRGIDNSILRAGATAAYGIGAGLDQFARGFERGALGWARPEETATSDLQYGSQYIREDLEDVGPEIFGSSLGQLGYDAVSTTANMLPSMALGAIHPALGAASIGLSAGGNAYDQAVQEGYTKDQARAYAVLSGASEAGLQYFLGGISKLGNNAIGNTALGRRVTESIQNIRSASLRVAAQLGTSMLSEASEEYLQEILEPVFRNLALGEDNEVHLVTEEAAYAALLAIITTGVLEGPEVVGKERQRIAWERAERALNQGEHHIIALGTAQDVARQVAEITGSAQGVEAVQAQKTAPAEGAVKEHHGEILDKIRENLSKIQTMKPVISLTGTEFQKTAGDKRNLRTKVIDFFNSLGNKVTRADIGEIELNDAGARDSTGHGYGKLKAATYAALPAVLEQGEIIAFNGPYEGHDYDSYFIAAPVTVNGTTCYVGALVIKDSRKQRYKLHEVLTTSESGTPLFKSETTNTSVNGPLRNGVPLEASGDASTDPIIPSLGDGVNTEYARRADEVIRNAVDIEPEEVQDHGPRQEEIHLRDSGKRADGAYPGGEVQELEGRTGQDQGGDLGGRPADAGAASLTYGETVTTASLGIGGGSTSDSVRLVTGGDTAATARAKATAKERGMRLILFGGGNLSIDQGDGVVASVRGYVSGDRMFVRVDHPEFTGEQIARHEAGHDMIAKGEIDPETVRERIRKKFGTDKAEQLAGMYEAAYRATGLSPEEIWEEVICDSLGDMNIFSETFLEEPAQELLEETKKAASAEKEASRNRGPPAVGGKPSIEFDKHNKPYVIIEEDILSGVPKSKWVKTVKDNLREKFPDGVTVGRNVIAINKQSRREMTFSKYMQRLMRTDKALFVDKLRATNNADEILRAAQNWVNEALLHPRKDDIIDFSRGEVLLRVGGNDYTGEVIVGSRGEGGLLLYDIINLAPTSIQEGAKKVGAAYTGIAQKERHGRQATPTDSSISETDENVNGKFSTKEKEIPDTSGKYAALMARSSSAFRNPSDDIVSKDEGEVKGKSSQDLKTIEVLHREFQRELRELDRDGRPGGESFILGSTGSVLQGLGAIESDIYMEGDKINIILEQHPEMTLEEIKRIPEILEDPVLVLKSKQSGKRLVMFGSIKAQDGRPIMCVLDLRPTDRGFLMDDMQKVASAYTKDANPYKFISESDVLFLDKKRATHLLSEMARTDTISCNQSGYIGSIDYKGGKVNLSGVPFSEVVESGGEASQSSQELKSIEIMREDYKTIMNRLKAQAQKEGWSDAKFRDELNSAVDRLYQGFIDAYGAIKAGENPAREVRVPRKTGEHEKVSQTVRTILEAKATSEDAIPTIQELVAKGEFSYEAITDKAAMDRASGTITEKNWGKALSDWKKEMAAGKVTKDNTALGWALYNNAANSGNLDVAMDILQEMVKNQRSAAQALQATRILKKLSPEGQLYGVVKSVEGLQKELNERYGEKDAPTLVVNKELGERLLEAKDQNERDEILKDIYRDIGRQLPSQFRDKWNAWRYLSMLGNPRTHVRNVVGNAGFAPVVAVKDLTATAIEKAVSAVSGGRLERSKAFVGPGKQGRALLSAAWADYAQIEEAALGGGKYSDMQNANKYIEEGRVIFWGKTVGKALEAVRKANSRALDVEDVWFSRPHYAYAMAQFCAAHKITEAEIRTGNAKVLAAARNYAIKEAQKATYRDTNALSQTFSRLGRDMTQGKNPVSKGVGVLAEGILPFRKTPANILARGLEYSPLGLVKSLSYDLNQVRHGEMTGAEAIDHISAGLTGTGILALGIYLAAQGLIRGRGEGDDKERELAKLQGHQDYALELGDVSVTLDWLAPEALPFFVGVNLWEVAQRGGNVNFSQMLEAVGNVSEPMLEMSCLQSLNDVLEAGGKVTSEGLGAVPSAIVSAATSYITQGLPTIFGQVERTAESQRETTYTEKSAFLTPDMQYTLGKVSGKIPVWEYQQIPYIDAWGRRESNGGLGERMVNNFLNPAYTSKIEETPMEKELLRLYQQTGEGSVLPKQAGKYFTVAGERRGLTAEEYVKYAEERGKMSLKLVTALTESADYSKLDDGDKAGAIKDAYTYATQVARIGIDRGYVAESWVLKAREAEAKHRISPDTYILLRNTTRDLESLKDNSGESIANSKGLLIMREVYKVKGLTNDQRQYLFEALGVGKTVQHYNRAAVEEGIERMRRKGR